MTTPPCLLLSGVRLSYGPHRVLDGANLTIEPGTVLGLLGANGAGKTTVISVATGLRRADSGSVFVHGIDVARHRLAAARHMGLAPQRLGVYPTLTARQNLLIFAELARLRGKAARTRVDEVLETLDLEEQAERVVGELSGGQQRRVHTGMALVSRPRLLFLDEPTVGADLESRRRILRTVRELADQGTAVLYTSHVLSEFEELSAEIAVLHDGRISARGSIAELLRDHSQASVELRFRSAAPPLAGWDHRDQRTLVRAGQFAPGAALTEAVSALGARAGDVDDLVDVTLRQPGLEDVFLALTGADWNASEGDERADDDARTAHGTLAADSDGARR